MQCANPWRTDGRKTGIFLPCGQCLPCRINRRREWTFRIMAEATDYEHSSFCTLTYDDEHLPKFLAADGNPQDTLDSRHLQLLLKRVRRRQQFRFFGVGEYGTKTGRPHYHLILFGIDHLEAQKLLKECWRDGKRQLRGFISTSVINRERSAYIAGYTVKKMMKQEDYPLGQTPEFSRQSRKPGIGVPFVERVLVPLMQTDAGQRFIGRHGDVVKVARLDGKIWPLDKTMVQHLRIHCGVTTDWYERCFHDRLARELEERMVEEFELAERVQAAVQWTQKQERLAGAGLQRTGEVL